MLESGSSGSVRGVPSNGHPYRDPPPISLVRHSPCEGQLRASLRRADRRRGACHGQIDLKADVHLMA